MTLQMLSHPPGSYKPISYEQMYSAVYKCVCKQYSDQLYADLMTHVNTRLAQWSSNLGSVADDNFILEFHKALVQYFHALGGIVPIFTYMNRLVKDGAVVVYPCIHIQNFGSAALQILTLSLNLLRAFHCVTFNFNMVSTSIGSTLRPSYTLT